MKATYTASPNIALIKYWGKRNEELMLPCEGSISVTLHPHPFQSVSKDKTRAPSLLTVTTVETITNPTHEIEINGTRIEGEEYKHLSRFIDSIRAYAPEKTSASLRIRSVNHFPTAAGVASSAAGFAALTYAIVDAYGLSLSSEDITRLARLGSGSACRSIFGGFVEWKRGKRKDGKDSIAVQIASKDHWPTLRDVIVFVNAEKKKISSRMGMRQTVSTSTLFRQRLRDLPARLSAARNAILQRDFQTLGPLIMRDSNSMHATMLDTYPPIIYLTDTSRHVIDAITCLNEAHQCVVAAYSFDAGPHAHILTEEKNVPLVIDAVKDIEGVKVIGVYGVGDGPQKINEHLV